MTQPLTIVLAQVNLTVGDLEGNLDKHYQAMEEAQNRLSADIIVFPELSLTGYSPEDLLLRKDFIHAAEEALEAFITATKKNNITCIVGHPYAAPKGLYNACSCICQGEIIGRALKQHLPNYGVFDEKRYFIVGHESCIISHGNTRIGVIICEDAWYASPAKDAKEKGAQLLIVPNASPFETDKHDRRLRAISARAKENQLPIVYVNLLGGQDEILFDGGSMVVDENGKLCQFTGFFKENLLPVTVACSETHCAVPSTPIALPAHEEKIYDALVMSVREYVHKNGFQNVCIGVSGGIDSALVLAIAVDALGANHVKALFMPSRYSAAMSAEDVFILCREANVKQETVSIELLFEAVLKSLTPHFENKNPDVTEENIQSRCRAIILMAFANKQHALVLTTGNRSEIATGYCTLYGDMVGAFNPLKDVFKTEVYRLAKYRNTISPIIPERIFTRAPSAELRANQTDQDTLPPYDLLDDILHRYLNKGKSRAELIAEGFSSETVNRVIQLIKQSEYKRHQAAPGTRINLKSFGKDWRYPITNGFKG